MRTHYVGCFKDGDRAEIPLTAALDGWPNADRHLSRERATNGDQLREKLVARLTGDELPDVLIIGGHGHASLSGFWVQDDAVRWHDLAFLLKTEVKQPCTFVFYSCNGGYPGLMHSLGRPTGIDYAFGPRIEVFANAMTRATMDILNWKERGGGNVADAQALVDNLNAWGAQTYADHSHDLFLRVMWAEGPAGRHPNDPNRQVPYGPVIPLRGWALD